MKRIILLSLVSVFLGLVACNPAEEKEQVVNVYTHRHYDVDKEIFKRFEESTGIKVNVVSASADELIMKLKQEGELSQADLLFTVDAGKIERAKTDGLLQAINSEKLNKNIFDKYRDTDNFWFGVALRARIIAVSKKVENPEAITYADLASEQFAGRVLMRSSDNIYNQSLVAAVIANNGIDSTEKWLTAVHKNLARDPKGNDRDQVRAIAAGEGDITVVNSYYIGKMANSGEARDSVALAGVNFIYPSDKTLNTHTNISAGGVCSYAPNKENAVKLLEFMSTKEIQDLFYSLNQEYPVYEERPVETQFSFVGTYQIDDLPLSALGVHQQEAVELFEKVSWK